MCASVYSSLLLLFTLTTTLSIFAGMRMVAEGLPILMRQERGADDKGILAGADFLSVFMSSSRNLHRYHHPTTTTTEATTAITTTLFPFSLDDDGDGEEESFVRATRSTNFLTTPPQIAQLDENNNNSSSSNNNNNKDETTLSAQDEQSSDSSLNDGVVLAVHVSSSIGRTLINKESGHQKVINSLETTTSAIFDETGEEFLDQNFVASEEHPSIVAEANKSEFNVEESEPITTNSELTNSNSNSNYLRGYPASVQPLPRGESAQFHNGDFIQQQIAEKKLQPIQQTVIYHNSPRERGRARSVSYSTVIQSVPNLDEKDWDKHERHERHYEGTQNAYNNNNNYQSIKNESKAGFEAIPKSYNVEASTRPTLFTTERNWEVPEKTYQRLPTVYGRPEQNYEVDESASVMTNGRVHGVQPTPTLVPKQEAPKVPADGGKKADDNQKVGYVVEGRNYRKYRVEERTSDGFIVGEYGVVSHDDGSLRGVRYTADGTINPRLIYDALMKFLSL